MKKIHKKKNSNNHNPKIYKLTIKRKCNFINLINIVKKSIVYVAISNVNTMLKECATIAIIKMAGTKSPGNVNTINYMQMDCARIVT